LSNSSQHTATTKYTVRAKFEVEGVVEKHDVIGAIFGQTEGLFGLDLDLRELQKGGRIGRIEIELDSKRDKTTGTIIIPSSLDRVSTSIIAAALESIDRIGPCSSKITLEGVKDTRDEKRKAIMEKAKGILRRWSVEDTPSTDEILKEVSNALSSNELIRYGPDQLPAGPEVAKVGSIVIVEGRADVISLLKCGIKNVIGLEGTKIPNTIIELCKDKETVAFLDGDRGGDLILKELMQVADVDYVARAPQGKEVEELTPKEIMKCLRDKVPMEQLKREKPPQDFKQIMPESVIGAAQNLRGTLEGIFFDESGNEISRTPVSELADKIAKVENAGIVLFDGVITQRLLDLAEEKNIRVLIGDRFSDVAKKPLNVKTIMISDLVGSQ